MKSELKRKIVSFFNDYVISLRDTGRLRLSVGVEQFIFLTEKRMDEKDETFRQALDYNFKNLIVAPPHHGVRESISEKDAIAKLAGEEKKAKKAKKADAKKDDDSKEEEVKTESKIKKVGKKKA